jgi:hypothetical protein
VSSRSSDDGAINADKAIDQKGISAGIAVERGGGRLGITPTPPTERSFLYCTMKPYDHVGLAGHSGRQLGQMACDARSCVPS